MSAKMTIFLLTPIVVPTGAPEMDPATRPLLEAMDQLDRALAQRDALKDAPRVGLSRVISAIDVALEQA